MIATTEAFISLLLWVIVLVGIDFGAPLSLRRLEDVGNVAIRFMAAAENCWLFCTGWS